MFRALYDSPWHHPVLAWVAALAFLLAWARKQPFLTAFAALFAVEILADATATGAWSPLALLHSSLETPVAILFVILGDLRFFLLVTRFARAPLPGPRDATPAAAWASAIGLSLLVPVVSTALGRTAFAGASDPRVTFLVYEALFVALAIALRFAILPRRLAGAPAPVRAWILRLASFELAQYALWVAADVVLLATKSDAGFALRLVPNALYYAAFLPFAVLGAPKEVTA
jgi:hypothetical protein